MTKNGLLNEVLGIKRAADRLFDAVNDTVPANDAPDFAPPSAEAGEVPFTVTHDELPDDVLVQIWVSYPNGDRKMQTIKLSELRKALAKDHPAPPPRGREEDQCGPWNAGSVVEILDRQPNLISAGEARIMMGLPGTRADGVPAHIRG